MTPSPQAASAAGNTFLERQVVTWAAGITAVAAIGYVVLGSYFPSFGWTGKMDKDVVPGLYNRYGNDCFANCVIQSLAGIPSFREYLRERVERDQNRDMKLSKSLMELLNGSPPVLSLDLLEALNLPARKERTKSVESVIVALEEMYKSRISRNQQDSQEFLHLIHEALSLEDTRLKKQHSDSEKLVIPPNPFEGELSTQIKCQRCNFTTPWKKEPFTELSVAVPSKWSCTLIECLGSLITTDSIPDYACPYCTVQNTLLTLELIPTKPAPLLRATSCLRAVLAQVNQATQPIDLDIDKINLPAQVEWKRLKVAAIKTTTVSRPPQVLAIHLVRSVYERGYGAGRNGCEVAFDEDLRIPVGGAEVQQRRAESAIEDEEEEGEEVIERYRLRSVVTHKGWHDSGHYICYRRRKRTAKPHRERASTGVSSIKSDVTEDVQEILDEKEGGGGGGDDKGEESDEIVGLGFEEEISRPIEQVDSRTKWWEISDEVVLGVSKAAVLAKRKGVYILFYERTL